MRLRSIIAAMLCLVSLLSMPLLMGGCGDTSQAGYYNAESDPAEYFRRIEEMHLHNAYQGIIGGHDIQTMPRL